MSVGTGWANRLRRATNARMEEMSFRSGVAVLAAVLALVGMGVALTLALSGGHPAAAVQRIVPASLIPAPAAFPSPVPAEPSPSASPSVIHDAPESAPAQAAPQRETTTTQAPSPRPSPTTSSPWPTPRPFRSTYPPNPDPSYPPPWWFPWWGP